MLDLFLSITAKNNSLIIIAALPMNKIVPVENEGLVKCKGSSFSYFSTVVKIICFVGHSIDYIFSSEAGL